MRAMSKTISALAFCLISVSGCSSFVDEPIYNVGYSYNLNTHKYTVRFKENPLSEEEEHVVPLDYVRNIAVREYPTHHYSSDEWVTVRNEYFKGTNHLYIYALI